MKGLSIFTAAVAVAVSSTAVAAPSAKSKPASSSASIEAPANSAKANSTSSPSATAVTTGGTVSSAMPKAPTKKWSADIYADNYYTVADANKGEGSMAAAAFVGVNRQLSEKMKVYIRQNFSADIAATSAGKDKFKFDDTELGLGLGKVVEWDNGGIAVTNRLYLPTGEGSRAAGQIARIREVIKTSQKLNKTFEIAYILDPRLHIQSQDSYMVDGKSKETAFAKLPQYAWLTGKMNSTFSTGLGFGTVDSWTRRSGTQASQSYLDINGSAQLTEQLSLTVGLDNSADIGKKQAQRHAFFRPSETSYYMYLFASM